VSNERMTVDAMLRDGSVFSIREIEPLRYEIGINGHPKSVVSFFDLHVMNDAIGRLLLAVASAPRPTPGAEEP